MFSRWGAFVYRARRAIVLAFVIVAVAMGFFATNASSHLSSGGWLDPASESAKVADRLAADFGTGRSSDRRPLPGSARARTPPAPRSRPRSRRRSPPVTIDPNVAGITGFAQTGDRRFISTKGDAAYAVIELTVTDDQSVALVDGIRAKLAPPAGYSVQLTGYGPLTEDSATLSEKDLQRAETVSASRSSRSS